MIRKKNLNYFEIGIWWRYKTIKIALLEREWKELIRLYKIGDWYLMLSNKKGKGRNAIT